MTAISKPGTFAASSDVYAVEQTWEASEPDATKTPQSGHLRPAVLPADAALRMVELPAIDALKGVGEFDSAPPPVRGEV